MGSSVSKNISSRVDSTKMNMGLTNWLNSPKGNLYKRRTPCGCMAHVVVARRHTNGNITVCFYLVDLMCLGVKDTFYMFNVPLFEYKEKIEMIGDGLDVVPISYELAHNIVYADLEFAEEYGFSAVIRQI